MGSFFVILYSMSNELLFVRKAVELFHGSSKEAIDLGCGYGRNALFLAENGFNVTAVDKYLDCLTDIENKTDKITIVHADLIDYKFTKNYDFILCTFVLHYFERNNARKFIKKMVKHLKKDGILAISLIRTPKSLSIDELMDDVADLSTVSAVEKIIHDNPHSGANYLHDHDVFFYIGTRE